MKKIPLAVISRNETQYGMDTIVFMATQGVYNVMPNMNKFRTMNVAEARRRTSLLLNLRLNGNKKYRFRCITLQEMGA